MYDRLRLHLNLKILQKVTDWKIFIYFFCNVRLTETATAFENENFIVSYLHLKISFELLLRYQSNRSTGCYSFSLGSVLMHHTLVSLSQFLKVLLLSSCSVWSPAKAQSSLCSVWTVRNEPRAEVEAAPSIMRRTSPGSQAGPLTQHFSILKVKAIREKSHTSVKTLAGNLTVNSLQKQTKGTIA